MLIFDKELKALRRLGTGDQSDWHLLHTPRGTISLEGGPHLPFLFSATPLDGPWGPPHQPHLLSKARCSSLEVSQG